MFFRKDYNAPGPGIRKDEPEKTGPARLLQIIQLEAGTIFLLPRLFGVSCIPGVPIPLAAAGFAAYFYFMQATKNLVMFLPFLVCTTILLVTLLSSGCFYGALGTGMKLKPALRLALAWGVGRPLRPIAAAIIGYGLLLFGILELPISLVYVLLLGFSAPCLLSNFFLRTLLREYCPAPKEEPQGEESHTES